MDNREIGITADKYIITASSHVIAGDLATVFTRTQLDSAGNVVISDVY